MSKMIINTIVAAAVIGLTAWAFISLGNHVAKAEPVPRPMECIKIDEAMSLLKEGGYDTSLAMAKTTNTIQSIFIDKSKTKIVVVEFVPKYEVACLIMIMNDISMKLEIPTSK